MTKKKKLKVFNFVKNIANVKNHTLCPPVCHFQEEMLNKNNVNIPCVRSRKKKIKDPNTRLDSEESSSKTDV